MMQIPFLNLPAQNAALRGEILPLWDRILQSAGFIGGEYVEEFEARFAAACDASFCLAVNSGTDALRFILIGLGLQPGDEVITAPNTFIATTEAISQAGGRIVFADIDPVRYTLDPEAVAAAITPRTRVIIPVHLYGQPAAMEELRTLAASRGIRLVEDACQAHLAEYRGRKAGSLGDAAAFSFYPGKNLGGCGEGGAVTTNDPALAATVKMLRDHGQSQKYIHEMEGYNGRCDALQAAALLVKLKYLPAWNQRRREHADRYRHLLRDLPGVVLPAAAAEAFHVYHLFVVLVEHRDRVRHLLLAKGVQTGLHYPVPLHLQTAYRALAHARGAFPRAEHCAERLLSLPLYPEMTTAQIDYVCAALAEAIRETGGGHGA